MPESNRPIVAKALEALAAFEVADADGALLLLSMWRHRGALTVEHIREILAHYRAKRRQAQVPAATLSPLTLDERADAPAAAVSARDCQHDKWVRSDGGVPGLWRYPAGTLIRRTRALVRQYGPIRWYDADGVLLAVSRPEIAR